MPIDASIPLQAGQGVTPLMNPLDVAMKAQALKQSGLNLQTGELELAKSKQAITDDQTARAIMQEANGDPVKASLIFRQRGLFKYADNLDKGLLEMRKQAADLSEKLANVDAKHLTAVKAANADFDALTLNAKDQQSWSMGLLQLAQTHPVMGGIKPGPNGEPMLPPTLAKYGQFSPETVAEARKNSTIFKMAAGDEDPVTGEVTDQQDRGWGRTKNGKLVPLMAGGEQIKVRKPPISPIAAGIASNYDGSTPMKPGFEPIARAIAKGDAEMLTSARGLPNFPDINARAAYLKAEAGGGDLEGKIKVQARAAGLKDFEGSGKANVTVRALNTMTEHVATARRLASALESGDLPLFNQLAQSLSKATGKPAVTNLDTLREFLAGEVATVAAGGHITEGAIKSAGDKLRLAQSPAQMTGALDVMDEVAAGKLVALNKDFTNLTGGKSLEHKLTAATLKVFREVQKRQGKVEAHPAAASQMKEGTISASGKYIWADGGWRKR